MRRLDTGGCRSQRWAVALAALQGALCFTEAGVAQTSPRTIVEWDAPPGCPGADALQQSLDDNLGHAAQLGRLSRVRGSIEKRAADWLLRLDLVSAEQQGTRLISAEHCYANTVDSVPGLFVLRVGDELVGVFAKSVFFDQSGSLTSLGTVRSRRLE
jgi:hypothetical protein